MILLSFCNTAPHHRGVFLHAGGREFRVLEGPDLKELGGVTGICRSHAGYWLGVQDGVWRSWLIELDSDLRVTARYELEGVGDIHDVEPWEDGFLLVDTTHDRVCRGRPGEPVETFWSCADGSAEDQLHVNSVAVFRGRPYVTRFGSRPEGGWSGADAGEVVDVLDGTVVKAGLRHPHSLVVHEDALHWLESKTGRMFRWCGEGEAEVVRELPGYLRGLAFDGEDTWVAASAFRRRSKSTGVTYGNAPGPDDPTSHSWLYHLRVGAAEPERHWLTGFGPEPYAIMPVSLEEPPGGSDWGARADRLWDMEAQLAATGAQLRELTMRVEGLRRLTEWWEERRSFRLLRRLLTWLGAEIPAPPPLGRG